MEVEPTKRQRSRKPLVASITEETSQDDDDEVATSQGVRVVLRVRRRVWNMRLSPAGLSGGDRGPQQQ